MPDTPRDWQSVTWDAHSSSELDDPSAGGADEAHLAVEVEVDGVPPGELVLELVRLPFGGRAVTGVRRSGTLYTFAAPIPIDEHDALAVSVVHGLPHVMVNGAIYRAHPP